MEPNIATKFIARLQSNRRGMGGGGMTSISGQESSCSDYAKLEVTRWVLFC
jgi:hypothetical protein